MKAISWNVNGFRAWKEKEGAVDFLLSENPDFICLQETKAQPEQINQFAATLFPKHGYQYFNSAIKKGYSSTAIFSKHEPISISNEIKGLDAANDEGRVITAEFKDYYLVNVYTPNSKPELARVEYRHKEWDVQFLKYLKKLEKKKPVILCGDLNVAHTEIDLKNPSSNKTTEKNIGNPGFSDREREGFDNYLNAGFIDTFRHLYPDTIERYSWWSYRFNARKNNSGWRIDYFLISDILKNKLKDAKIHDDITGSDHCPVSIEMK